MQPILVIIISTIVFFLYFNISEVMTNRRERKRIRKALAELEIDMAEINTFRHAVSPEFYKSRKLSVLEKKDMLTQLYPKKRGFFK